MTTRVRSPSQLGRLVDAYECSILLHDSSQLGRTLAADERNPPQPHPTQRNFNPRAPPPLIRRLNSRHRCPKPTKTTPRARFTGDQPFREPPPAPWPCRAATSQPKRSESTEKESRGEERVRTFHPEAAGSAPGEAPAPAPAIAAASGGVDG